MAAQVSCKPMYSYTLSVLLVLLPGASRASPIMAPQDTRGARGVLNSALLKQEGDLDVQDLLGQFLSTFNLTELGPCPKPRAARKEPPEYMLELYNRFAHDRTTVPSDNIIRSFKNEDSSPYSVTSMGVRRHPLLFNISIPPHEHITTAQLRLYTLVQRDRRCFAGLDREVTVYKIHSGGFWRAHGGTGRRGKEEEIRETEELATRRVRGEDDAWVSFDLTHALRAWRKTDCTTHRLEVHIANVEPEHEETPQKITDEVEQAAGVDTDRSSEGKHKPVVIVFSDDQSIREDRREIQQLMEQDNDLPANLDVSQQPLRAGDNRNGGVPDNEEQDKQTSLARLHSNLIYDTPPRVRRNVKGESCKRTPLRVEFKDIGWDSWVIQPLGYDAYECNGVCNPPMTSEVSPTKHAIVQTLLSVRRPQMASRACCVPTKLDPISLLYMDGGVVTYKHKYEGMVVAECGCR
ncbi:bone morphogenetic protein 10-like [Osmerus eperlanus]|uniref:bone morphogenetic protein 10-like n=1 Tax=Osmerus eperlanus TaxID=29151 RepID=UPI002E15F114